MRRNHLIYSEAFSCGFHDIRDEDFEHCGIIANPNTYNDKLIIPERRSIIFTNVSLIQLDRQTDRQTEKHTTHELKVWGTSLLSHFQCSSTASNKIFSFCFSSSVFRGQGVLKFDVDRTSDVGLGEPWWWEWTTCIVVFVASHCVSLEDIASNMRWRIII